MKLLTIDIGNTTINSGVFSAGGNRLFLNFSLPTGKRKFYKKDILKALTKAKIKTGEISKIIVCSVVPRQTKVLGGLLSRIFKRRVLIAGRDIKIPIKNKYRNPKQVGTDRLVNAFSGLRQFGPGLILVDFGTAITFDVVSKKGEYLGGLIFPGLDLSLDALNKKTALLPRIKIKKPKSLIGRDTTTSINNGIVFGMAGICDQVIARLQKEYIGYKIIATGGNVEFIKKYSKKIRKICPHLTLEGLRILSCQTSLN